MSVIQASDAAAGIAFDDTIRLLRIDDEPDPVESVTWFVGICKTIPRRESNPESAIAYTIKGPWYWLTRCVYQQRWRMLSPDTGELELLYKSRIILGTNEDGDHISTGEQIRDIVQFAIDVWHAPLQLPAGDFEDWGWPAIKMPLDEQVDLYAADAINRLLGYTPDYAASIDYTTTPLPTFNIVQRESVTGMHFDLADLDEWEILERKDLVPAGLIIRFELVGPDDDDALCETIEVQTAGDTDDSETLVHTVEMRTPGGGGELSQRITTYDWPATDWSEKAWWKARVKSIAGIDDADLVISAPTTDYADGLAALKSTYPKVLLRGTVNPWMGVKCKSVKLTVPMTLTIRDALGAVARVEEVVRTLRVVATDAATGAGNEKTYFFGDVGSPVVTPPEGMAAALYASWSILQYEGHVRIDAAECVKYGDPAEPLNIDDAGVAVTWAEMNAQVKSIVYDIVAGSQVISFGPSDHIAPSDLASLLWALNARKKASGYDARDTGYAADSGGGTHADEYVPENDSESSPGETTKLVLADTDSGTEERRKIDNDASLIPTGHGDLIIQPREVLIVESDGGTGLQVKTRCIMASTSYGDATALGPAIPVPSGSNPGTLCYHPGVVLVWVYASTLYQLLQRTTGNVLAFDWTRAR
jgi:hypothetical protein